ncbi:hypothetical protein HDU93_000062 [Gonapodya sp. JEL0774]|nr:hypothetical protein HDU93_000062 [Gonapodya sp. JEL0774]
MIPTQESKLETGNLRPVNEMSKLWEQKTKGGTGGGGGGNEIASNGTGTTTTTGTPTAAPAASTTPSGSPQLVKVPAPAPSPGPSALSQYPTAPTMSPTSVGPNYSPNLAALRATGPTITPARTSLQQARPVFPMQPLLQINQRGFSNPQSSQQPARPSQQSRPTFAPTLVHNPATPFAASSLASSPQPPQELPKPIFRTAKGPAGRRLPSWYGGSGSSGGRPVGSGLGGSSGTGGAFSGAGRNGGGGVMDLGTSASGMGGAKGGGLGAGALSSNRPNQSSTPFAPTPAQNLPRGPIPLFAPVPPTSTGVPRPPVPITSKPPSSQFLTLMAEVKSATSSAANSPPLPQPTTSTTSTSLNRPNGANGPSNVPGARPVFPPSPSPQSAAPTPSANKPSQPMFAPLPGGGRPSIPSTPSSALSGLGPAPGSASPPEVAVTSTGSSGKIRPPIPSKPTFSSASLAPSEATSDVASFVRRFPAVDPSPPPAAQSIPRPPPMTTKPNWPLVQPQAMPQMMQPMALPMLSPMVPTSPSQHDIDSHGHPIVDVAGPPSTRIPAGVQWEIDTGSFPPVEALLGQLDAAMARVAVRAGHPDVVDVAGPPGAVGGAGGGGGGGDGRWRRSVYSYIAPGPGMDGSSAPEDAEVATIILPQDDDEPMDLPSELRALRDVKAALSERVLELMEEVARLREGASAQQQQPPPAQVFPLPYTPTDSSPLLRALAARSAALHSATLRAQAAELRLSQLSSALSEALERLKEAQERARAKGKEVEGVWEVVEGLRKRVKQVEGERDGFAERVSRDVRK